VGRADTGIRVIAIRIKVTVLISGGSASCMLKTGVHPTTVMHRANSTTTYVHGLMMLAVLCQVFLQYKNLPLA